MSDRTIQRIRTWTCLTMFITMAIVLVSDVHDVVPRAFTFHVLTWSVPAEYVIVACSVLASCAFLPTVRPRRARH